jgi:predicted unusual protein kinase regulating ubiquinone biosynthesis (AarF/ABC1/UbiB family)
VPAAPWREVEPRLLEQLNGPLEEVFASFDQTPVAAGSIGQIYRAERPDGRPVAVKVLRPGIERQVEEDGQLLRQVAALASQTPLGARYDLPGLADQLVSALEGEIDFRSEARHTQRLAELLERSNFAKPLHQLNFALFLADLLQIANACGLQVPGNLGLFVKAVTNLEGVGRDLNPDFCFTEAMKPLVTRLMARALLLPQQRVLQFGLDLRSLVLEAPRQLSGLLQRFSGDDLVFAFQLQGLDRLLANLDVLSRRIALAILVASLLLSATVMATQSELQLLRQLSEVLFIAANVLGVWLVVSLMRSGRR